MNCDHVSVNYQGPLGSGGQPSCSEGAYLATTGPMTYYSTDGSYTKLVVEHNSDPNERTGGYNPWTLYFPDGRRVSGNRPNEPQRVYDRNNNYVDLLYITYNDHPAKKIVDQFGRYLIIETDGQYDPWTGRETRQDYIYMQGIGGEQLRWTVKWKQIYVYKEYYTTAAGGGRQRGNSYKVPWEAAYLVVDQISLPAQAGGLTYTFGYNAGDYAGDTQILSHGWGELSSVTLPSSAKASYKYELDGVNASASSPKWKNVLNNSPTQKDLTYELEYDGSRTPTTETWHYSPSGDLHTFGSTIDSITGPDGGIVEESFNTDTNSPYRGKSFKTVQPDGMMVERLWQENRAPGLNGVSVNPYIKTEFTSLKNAAGTYVKTAIKDYDYDKNGNITVVREYDWVAYTDVNRDALGRPTGIPAGATLKRVSSNEYWNETPIASDTTSNSPNAYYQANSPRLLKAVKATEVSDGSQTQARTEFFYDDAATTGNLTEQKSWDSHKGGVARPLTRPLGLNSADNWIGISHQYDNNTQEPALRYGNRTLTTDAKGVQTQFIYGAVGGFTDLYPTEIKVAKDRPEQRITRQDYDFSTGLVTRSTDVDNNVATSTTYDALGRPRLVKAAAGQPEETRTATEYVDTERRVVIRSDLNTAGDGRLVSVRHYDQLGRLRLSRQLEAEQITPQHLASETIGIKVQTRHLISGTNSYQLVSNPYRAASSSAAGSETTMGWTRTTADQGGRVVEVRSFAGATLPAPWPGGTNSDTTGAVLTTYEAQYTTVLDQDSKVRRSQVDGLGRLVRVDEPNDSNSLGTVAAPAQPTQYTYDALGNLTQVRQGGQFQDEQYTGGQTRSFQYSSLSRLVATTNPEVCDAQGVAIAITYQYDQNGNLTQKQDARGITTTYTYDNLNRLTHRDYSDTTADVSYTYDTLAQRKGQLTSVSSSVSSYHYTGYDAVGRVTSSSQVTGGQTYTMPNYTYDRAGHLTAQTYPSGRIVTTEYDAAGRIAGVKNQTGSYYAGAAATDATNRFQYAAHGALAALRLGNGLWEHTNFNSRLQPTEIGLGGTSADSIHLRLGYSYGTTENNGNLRTQTITAPNLTLQQSYTYDEVNRLETAREMNGAQPVWQQSYGYDRYGNRAVLPGSLILNAAQTPQSLSAFTANTNRLTNGSYDNAGNLTVDAEGHTYAYDGENRQTSYDGGASSSGGANYSYDGDGRRVKKVAGVVTTLFVYNALGQVVAEYAENQPPSNSSGTSYLTADALGSIRARTDAAGVVKERHDYLPFGEELYAAGGRSTVPGYMQDSVRQKFTSKERDNETGLDYFLARYYSSAQGRFTSVDPLMASARTADPQTWNRYSYTWNNPINLIDPLGLDPQDSRSFSVTNPCQEGSPRCGPAFDMRVTVPIGPDLTPIETTDTQIVTELQIMPGVAQPIPPATSTQSLATGGVLAGAAVLAAIDGPAPFGDVAAGGLLGWRVWLGLSSGILAAGTSDLAVPRTNAIPDTAQPDNRNFMTVYHYTTAGPENFVNGLLPGSSATDHPGLTAESASVGLGITPPTLVYPVTFDPKVTRHIIDVVPPNKYGLGGLTDYRFPSGTPPGSVGPPRPVPSFRPR